MFSFLCFLFLTQRNLKCNEKKSGKWTNEKRRKICAEVNKQYDNRNRKLTKRIKRKMHRREQRRIRWRQKPKKTKDYCCLKMSWKANTKSMKAQFIFPLISFINLNIFFRRLFLCWHFHPFYLVFHARILSAYALVFVFILFVLLSIFNRRRFSTLYFTYFSIKNP